MEQENEGLSEALKGARTKGSQTNIDLYERFWVIKRIAKDWLKDLDKNGYEHSSRVEGYLDRLCSNLLKRNLITQPEIFVLLCSAYMHDLGYLYNGRLERAGHEKRSYDLILANPKAYHLDDFPVFGDGHPRVAKAIALVCYGHVHETELALSAVPYDFADQTFEESILNLKKLTALLRLADESDDAYLRLRVLSPKSVRSQTPLVEVDDGKIIWYRDPVEVSDPRLFEDFLKEKKQLLTSSLDYLNEIGLGMWHLLVYPEPAASPYMAKIPVETFTGREKDLEELHSIMTERGVGAITGIIGTGGIGKTEFARMYAQRHRKDYPAGVFWASLKGSNWQEEGRNILIALYPGWKPEPFPDDARAKEEICKRLNRSGALLVIDNVNEADQIIKPGCSVLVTTRERKAFGMVARKAIKELPQMSDTEGKDLMIKILGETRVKHDFVGASRIVVILGGMPLALEIAAWHLEAVPDKSFPDYIGEIQGKIRELKLDGVEDKDVVASLELSLEQLAASPDGPKCVALYEVGSVCAESGFTSHTLAYTAGIDYKLAQAQAGELHHRSLFEFDEKSGRYSMHPLLRQLSEMRLAKDPGREDRFRMNHCHYFLRFAEAKSNSPEELIAEKDGLWQAMVQANQTKKALELLPIFLSHLTFSYQHLLAGKKYEEAFRYLGETKLIHIDELGLAKNLVTILEPLAKSQASIQESSLERFYNSFGVAYMQVGEYQKAVELYEKVLEIAHRIGDVRGEGASLGNMGSAYMQLGEYRKAIDLFEKTLEIDRRIEDVRGEEAFLGNMGLAHANLGEYRKAINLYEKALEIARRIGDAQGEGKSLGNMGLAYANLGEYQKAIDFSEKALEIDRRIGDVGGEGKSLGCMGHVYADLGEYRKAIDLFEETLEINRRIGDVQGEGSALSSMGLAYVHLGEYRKAIDLCEKCLEIARRIGNVQGEGSALSKMGIAYVNLGEYRKAIDLFEEALEINRRIGDVQGEGITLGNMGIVYAKLGEYRKAIDLYEKDLEIARRIGDAQQEGNALGNMGLAYTDLGEYQKAINLFKKSLEICHKIGYVRGEGASLGNMGKAYAKMGKKEDAAKYFEESKTVFRRLGLQHLVMGVEKMAKSVGL